MSLINLQQFAAGGQQPFLSFLATNIPRGYGKFAVCIACTVYSQSHQEWESLFNCVTKLIFESFH